MISNHRDICRISLESKQIIYMYYTAEQAYTFSTFYEEYLRPKHKVSNLAKAELAVVCFFCITEV